MEAFFATLALATFALPARWGLRLVGLQAVFLGFLAFEPDTATQSPWDDMAYFGVARAIASMALGVLLRVGWEFWRHSGVVRAARDAAALWVVDGLLLALVGAWFGVFAFSRLGWLLADAEWPLVVHGVVGAAALAAAYVMVRWARGMVRPLGFGAALTLLFLVDDSALRNPARVLSAVDEIAQTGARCLVLGASGAAPHVTIDLFAMTMAKGGPSALMLVAGQGAALRTYRWSFRARRFVPMPFSMQKGGCMPHLAPLLAVNLLP